MVPAWILKVSSNANSDRIAANQKNGYQNQLGTRILLLKLVLLMAEQDLFYPSHTKSTSSLQKELLSYIQQNYCFRISLHDLAGHFHMSEKYISRYFREHFQLTLSQYITYLRLSHAKHLLETTSLSIITTPPPPILSFFNDTATTEIYTLSLHDALPIWIKCRMANASV